MIHHQDISKRKWIIPLLLPMGGNVQPHMRPWRLMPLVGRQQPVNCVSQVTGANSRTEAHACAWANHIQNIELRNHELGLTNPNTVRFQT
jgi:hypothetical protein